MTSLATPAFLALVVFSMPAQALLGSVVSEAPEFAGENSWVVGAAESGEGAGESRLLAAFAAGAAAGASAPASVARTCNTESPRAGLVAVGITPESLALADVSVNEAAGVMALGRAYYVAQRHTIGAAVADLEAAAGACQALEDRVMRGLAGEGEADDLGAMRASRDAARFARDAAYGDLFAAATAGLSAEQRAALEAMHTSAHRGLPREYRLLDLTELQALNLRDYLAVQRIAEARNEAPPESVSPLNQGEQAAADAASAAAALNGRAIAAVWASML